MPLKKQYFIYFSTFIKFLKLPNLQIRMVLYRNINEIIWFKMKRKYKIWYFFYMKLRFRENHVWIFFKQIIINKISYFWLDTNELLITIILHVNKKYGTKFYNLNSCFSKKYDWTFEIKLSRSRIDDFQICKLIFKWEKYILYFFFIFISFRIIFYYSL